MQASKKLSGMKIKDHDGNEVVIPKTSFGKKATKGFKQNWQIYSLLLLPLIWLIIFQYIPMAGNAIAFRRFAPGGSILGETFVGWHFFQMFWADTIFWRVFWNTVILGVGTLLWTFPMPIIFALLLNEIKSKKFKKVAQTLSYLPHFLSVVVVVGLIQQLTRTAGPINNLLYSLGFERIPFLMRAEWFRTVFITSRVWQTTGWGTILYLAALTNIDPTLYEAAMMDGANRWQQTLFITLPGIAPTVITLLILNVGWVLGVNFEQVLLLQDPLTFRTSDIIGTYLFRLGIEQANFSFATAVGLFQSLIGIFLLTITNLLSKKLTDTSLW
ncbi:MAG: ABC transporter permease subunit [Turicibacter sp.]|nr:ABC transporter permease subunit [Turicibacter sp.]